MESLQKIAWFSGGSGEINKGKTAYTHKQSVMFCVGLQQIFKSLEQC